MHENESSVIQPTLDIDVIDGKHELAFDAKVFSMPNLGKIIKSQVNNPVNGLEIILSGTNTYRILDQEELERRFNQDGELFVRRLSSAMVHSHAVTIRHDIEALNIQQLPSK